MSALGPVSFAKLINHTGAVHEVSNKDFDPREQYKEVVEAVKIASDGALKIFALELGGTRTEYWIVGRDAKEKRIVGLKVLAVES